MARPKKDPNAKAVKMSLEDKIALLKEQAKNDDVIASALPAVEQIFEQVEESKATFKRNTRRLRKLIAGLTSGD